MLQIDQERQQQAKEYARIKRRLWVANELFSLVYAFLWLIAGWSVGLRTANSYAENLIQRAADVCLKEGRPLLLAVRETPLHPGHLHLMSQAAQAGAIIFPPIPTFYDQPKTIDDLVNATVGRMLARIGIDNQLFNPWDKSLST